MKKPFSSDDGVSRYSESEKTAKKKHKKLILTLNTILKWLVSVEFTIQAIYCYKSMFLSSPVRKTNKKVPEYSRTFVQLTGLEPVPS